MNSQELLDKIAYNVVSGSAKVTSPGRNLCLKNQPGVIELVEKALDQKIDPKEIVVESLAKPMEEVIKKYKAEDYQAFDVLASAKCTGVAMQMLKPQLKEIGIKPAKFVNAVVKGDFHTTEAEVVNMLVKGFGYETINLVPDVSANRIVDAAKNNKAAYVGLSAHAFNVPTRAEIKHVMNKLENERIRDEIKIIVGGVATSAQFADQIGADAYYNNAFEIIDVLKRLDNISGFAGVNLN